MTTMAAPSLGTPGPLPVRLIRSEFLKIRTTSAWWLFGLGSLVMTGLALLINAVSAHFLLAEEINTEGMSPEQAAAMAAQQDVVLQAANIYTSGQFFGLLFVMLIGILMVTNEFFHQTATTTFLTTPHRTAVIFGKLAAAVLLGFGFWLVTTIIDVVVGAIFLNSEGYGHHLGTWDVQRAILMNLLAYAIWTIFGVGFGTLITNQLGAVITATVAYLLGTFAAAIIFQLVAQWLDNPAIQEWQVIVPSIASQVMISGGADIPGSPSWWVGALVLVGYAVVTGLFGILITRRRDVS